MTAPIPSVTRLNGPSARLRVVPSAASASARSVVMDLVAQSDIGDPGEWLKQSPPAGGRRNYFWYEWDDSDVRRDGIMLHEPRAYDRGQVKLLIAPLSVPIHSIPIAAAEPQPHACRQDDQSIAVKPWLQLPHPI